MRAPGTDATRHICLILLHMYTYGLLAGHYFNINTLSTHAHISMEHARIPQVYWAVRTLADGTKIRHKISADDPLLKRVPITKLRKSASTSSTSKVSAPPPSAAASSFSSRGLSRMSPPRQWPARMAEVPRRTITPSSESSWRSSSEKHREITRGGHAKISPPRDEVSGKKRTAVELTGDRKR